MDTSESSFGSRGCSINVVDEDEDSRCNWDVELLQFVVESFICMFPERQGEKRELRPRDARGTWEIDVVRLGMRSPH